MHIAALKYSTFLSFSHRALDHSLLAEEKVVKWEKKPTFFFFLNRHCHRKSERLFVAKQMEHGYYIMFFYHGVIILNSLDFDSLNNIWSYSEKLKEIPKEFKFVFLCCCCFSFFFFFLRHGKLFNF